ncbi:glycosyltransferase [Ferruginibacter paludis]|uniref:glycosyltransferase n=1 Tax=Ferruginibacter paludis TaxID=1310417 RepID=UPI0025B34AB2|nr:glycosyltransferase [Ferruginibacter paludis]MDN3658328.1 glycosyltransferase [Ferruginibacter paludis]
MQKKKVAILINALEVAGAEKVVAQIINSFYKEFDLHLILLNNTIEFELPVNDITIKTIDNSNLKKRKSAKDVLKIPLLAFRLKKYLQQENINICFSALNRSNYINCFLRILNWKGAILISERSHTSSAYNPHTIAGKTGRLLVKKLYPFANVIVPNSAGIQHDLTTNFHLTNSFTVIHNPVNITMQQKDMAESVDDVDFSSFTFSHVARIEKGKNHELVLAAVQKIKQRDFKVLLIGQGPEEEHIKLLSHKMGISDKIVFLGYRRNVVKYVARSQCHLLTSDSEGFPNALLEALTCGTPVISTDCPTGPRELLDCAFTPTKHSTGIEKATFGLLIPVNDAAALADAMLAMIDDANLRNEYAAAGIRRAKDFDLSIIMKQFADLLHQF